MKNLYEFVPFDKETSSSLNSHFYKRLYKANSNSKIMVTPCEHAFHPVCLLKWSEIKMECPCCRSILPLIY